MVVVGRPRVSCAVVTVEIGFPNDVIARCDVLERVNAVGTGGRAGYDRFAVIGQAIPVDVLHQIERNIADTGLADVIRAEAVGVVPNCAADGRVNDGVGQIIEEVIVRIGRQGGDVDSDAVVNGSGADEPGQVGFHDDVMPDSQVQKLVVTSGIGSGDFHQ